MADSPNPEHPVMDLEALPAVKWRCPHCRAAYQELRAFACKGTVEMALYCHRCGQTSRVVQNSTSL